MTNTPDTKNKSLTTDISMFVKSMPTAHSPQATAPATRQLSIFKPIVAQVDAKHGGDILEHLDFFGLDLAVRFGNGHYDIEAQELFFRAGLEVFDFLHGLLAADTEPGFKLHPEHVDGFADLASEMLQFRQRVDCLVELGEFRVLTFTISIGDQKSAADDGLHEVAIFNLGELRLAFLNLLSEHFAKESH